MVLTSVGGSAPHALDPGLRRATHSCNDRVRCGTTTGRGAI